jgi:hypothetical protein
VGVDIVGIDLLEIRVQGSGSRVWGLGFTSTASLKLLEASL